MLPDCESLDYNSCLLFSNECIFETSCKTKDCFYFTSESKCVAKKCEWFKQNKSCTKSKVCASLEKENCLDSKQNGKQCILIGEDENQFCTDIGCRYLQIKYSLCNGAQFGEETCVSLSDSSCVSCSEILDPCICLQYQDDCKYDRFHNVCESRICQSFTQESCPSSKCFFDENKEICIPFCQNNYNRQQCNLYEFSCYWDKEQSRCYQMQFLQPQNDTEDIIKEQNIDSYVLRVFTIILVFSF